MPQNFVVLTIFLIIELAIADTAAEHFTAAIAILGIIVGFGVGVVMALGVHMLRTRMLAVEPPRAAVALKSWGGVAGGTAMILAGTESAVETSVEAFAACPTLVQVVHGDLEMRSMIWGR